MSVKLICGSIKRGVAPPADVNPCFEKVVIFSSEGRLRSFRFNNILLFRGEPIVGWIIHRWLFSPICFYQFYTCAP